MKLAKHVSRFYLCVVMATILFAAALVSAQQQSSTPAAKPDDDKATVKAEHTTIGVEPAKEAAHTSHPAAQWFPDAGLGLFIHWGIASVKAINISWPMIPGRALATKELNAAERERVIREGDYNLDGKPNSITPNQYWAMAPDFNPSNYDPDKWLKAAKAAGFKYVVLTARHHEGFALWPSAYGNFNTKNYMGGRDLLKPYVEAARRNGLKVGLYYSPPDWYFDREFMNFLYGGGARKNPLLPSLGPDLQPRVSQKSEAEIAAHQAAYAAMVKGQVEELLTRYGKIDLLWFDGRPNIPGGNNVITVDRIRELQPGIVINPRLHGKGDFLTYERRLTTDKIATGWAEFCNTWTNSWPHVAGARFRANGFVLGQFVTARSLGINYLLGVGPMASGEFTPEIYSNMAVVARWMRTNGSSVSGTHPLPAPESASVPATAAAATRYLFLLPRFKEGGSYDDDMLAAEDATVTLKGVGKPKSVKLLGDGKTVEYTYSADAVTINVPANRRTRLVDVLQITFL
jgi:alpha-L-fucosidase